MNHISVPEAALECLKDFFTNGYASDEYAQRLVSVESTEAQDFWRRLVEIREAAKDEESDRRFWTLILIAILFPLGVSLAEKKQIRNGQNEAVKQLKKIAETSKKLAIQLEELSKIRNNGAYLPNYFFDIFELFDHAIDKKAYLDGGSLLPEKFDEFMQSLSYENMLESPPLDFFINFISERAGNFTAAEAFKEYPFLSSQKSSFRDYARQIRGGLNRLIGEFNISPAFVRSGRIDDRYSLFGEPQWLYLLNVIKGCHPPVTRDQLKDAFT